MYINHKPCRLNDLIFFKETQGNTTISHMRNNLRGEMHHCHCLGTSLTLCNACIRYSDCCLVNYLSWMMQELQFGGQFIVICIFATQGFLQISILWYTFKIEKCQVLYTFFVRAFTVNNKFQIYYNYRKRHNK